MQVSFLKDSGDLDSNSSSQSLQDVDCDGDIDINRNLDFSKSSTPTTSTSSKKKRFKRKRVRVPTGTDIQIPTPPPTKRQRSRSSASSRSSSRSSQSNTAEENAPKPQNTENRNTVTSPTNATDHDGKSTQCEHENQKQESEAQPETEHITEDTVERELSEPLSSLQLSDQNNSKNSNSNSSGASSKYEEIFCNHSYLRKWDCTATPIKSSMKKKQSKKPRVCRDRSNRNHNSNSKKSVNWGNIEFRKYEQRCGVLSCGVPNESGPSLHLGKFLSCSVSEIDEYEHGKRENGRKWNGELSKRERINRVKQFSPMDVKKEKLKQDTNEINALQRSRTENIGCKCVSVYKMKKADIVDRIVFLCKDDEEQTQYEQRKLSKLKKNEVFRILIRLQFIKYGRYDVCCVDEQCECFRAGIECQIDSECCNCGGDTIYNNYLPEEVEAEAESEQNAATSKVTGHPKKKDSLSCANPHGNTLNASVLDYVDTEGTKAEHDKVKTAESSILAFTSPYVQKRISEWEEHYNDENEIVEEKNQ